MADCYSKSFVEKAQESADLIGCDLGYAVGSNHLLEKCFKATGTHNFWLRSRDIRLLTKISLNSDNHLKPSDAPVIRRNAKRALKYLEKF